MRLLPIFALTFTSLFVSSVCFAQHWQDIATFPVREAAPYFLNENYGFVFTPGIQGPQADIITDSIALWRTTDGGTTWKYIDLGLGHTGNIWQLYFVSPSHGYMAMDASANGQGARGLFETNDSGSHWLRLRTKDPTFVFKSFISVYASGSNLYAVTLDAYDFYNGTALLWRSTDAGYTWRADSTIHPDLVTGNRENIVEASGPNGGWYLNRGPQTDSEIYTSSDYGAKWLTSHGGSSLYPGGGEQWSQFVFPHTATIVVSQERLGADSCGLDLTTNGGSGWSLPYRAKVVLLADGDGANTIGSISGDGCAVYVERSNGDSAFESHGCLRSTDYGQSWTNVGGPVHRPDARTLSVTGHGAVVYAMADSNANGTCDLWKTTDGGDGALSPNVPISVTMGHTLGVAATGGDTLLTKLCDSASLSMWLQFVGSCDYGGLTGVTIDGIDSSSAAYSVVSTHHPWSALLPDTAAVTIYPLRSGVYPLTVHAHYTDDDVLGGDTTFHVVLEVRGEPRLFASQVRSETTTSNYEGKE